MLLEKISAPGLDIAGEGSLGVEGWGDGVIRKRERMYSGRAGGGERVE